MVRVVRRIRRMERVEREPEEEVESEAIVDFGVRRVWGGDWIGLLMMIEGV